MSTTPERESTAPLVSDEPAPDIPALRGSIKASAEKCRNTLLAMLGAMLYLLVTVGSTTDKDLLMPVNQLELPVVSAKVGLISFYVMAPVLLVLFHLTLLFYLMDYRRQLAKLAQYDNGHPSFSYHAFLFNTWVRRKPGTIDYFCVSTLSNIAIVIAPYFLLILMEIRFSDYQSASYTLWHFILVLLDLLLLALFWERMENDKWLDDDYNHPGKLLWAACRRGSVIGWCNLPILLAWFVFWTASMAALDAGQLTSWYELRQDALTLQWLYVLFGILMALIILLQPANWAAIAGFAVLAAAWLQFAEATTGSLVPAQNTHDVSVYDSISAQQFSAYPAWLLVFALVLVWIVYRFNKRSKLRQKKINKPLAWMMLNGTTVAFGVLMILLKITLPTTFEPETVRLQSAGKNSGAEHPGPTSQQQVLLLMLGGQMPDGVYCVSMEWICPRLNLKGELVSAMNQSQIQDLLKQRSVEAEGGNGLDSFNSVMLSGRFLRMANFSSSSLYNVRMEAAHAEGSLWNDAVMRNVNAVHAKFVGADFIGVKALGINMSQADLSEANLSYSELHEAHLYKTKLQGAYFSHADWSGVDLSQAEVSKANVSDVKLYETAALP
jgi:hypothetical protein